MACLGSLLIPLQCLVSVRLNFFARGTPDAQVVHGLGISSLRRSSQLCDAGRLQLFSLHRRCRQHVEQNETEYSNLQM